MSAERFHPPARRIDWVAERDLDEAALRATALEFGLHPEQWPSVLHHQGVWVDKARARTARAGQHVRVYAFDREPEPLPVGPVVWSHGRFLAVDKPSWLPTQETRASAVIGLEPQLRVALGDPGLRAVHRLDRETSGLVLFARTGPAAGRLHALFRDRQIHKLYQAHVAAPTPDTFVVDAPITRAHHARHSKFTAGAGQPARTRFRRTPTWLEASPETGRTHQIRVHLAHAGAPIVGDRLYGGAPADRLMLHAKSLAWTLDGESFEVASPRDLPQLSIP